MTIACPLVTPQAEVSWDKAWEEMAIRDSWRDPVLINTVGHCAGALLFSVIMLLFWRNWRAHSTRVKLPLLAAALALGWNVGSLVVLGSRNANADWRSAVMTVSFCMLSMLPAVLLHVAIQARNRLIVATGYLISFSATALHLATLFSSNSALHQAALIVIVLGFGTLSVAIFMAGFTKGEKRDTPQLVSLAFLLLFTCSFLHFGYQHTGSPWAAEVTWHHIGIPVALIVLLRDYRFLLLDTFLRFVVNFGLAVVYVGCVLAFALQLNLRNAIGSSVFLTGLSLVAACFSLILFAYLRNALQTWMNRVIFRRQSVDSSVRTIERLAATAHSEQHLLQLAAQQIAAYLRTSHFSVAETGIESGSSSSVVQERTGRVTELVHGQTNAGGRFPDPSEQESFRPEAQIPLRFSSGENRYLLFGRRRGGQRYWSDDVNDMRVLGMAVTEQVERFRAEELRRLATQAELRALQAQINPHFLFNALNTLYGTIDRQSRTARQMVLNLAEMFRYFLQGHRTLIPLSEEIRIVEAYLEIEALRLGDRLTPELLISDSARSCLIPILSVQPLVENAVKHGASPKAGPCKVTVRAETLQDGVRISVEDTGIGFAKSGLRSHNGTGLGLENVRRRLVLSYGAAAHLDVESSDAGTTVSFLVPGSVADEPLAAKEQAYVHSPVIGE